MGFTISTLDKKGAACRAGIRVGDTIESFNGEAFLDYIDYIFFSSYGNLDVEFLSKGHPKSVHIVKDPDEPLGLDFEEGLLGRKRVCANKCLFCFVDQLPKGMRKSLYVKDEDWRYSFIMGNYVTLSDISDAELMRIIKRKASPLYISVHTVDEALRQKLLGNPYARPIRPVLEQFAKNGIAFHAQIVVCKGINDGAALRESMEYLYAMAPVTLSLALVPSGLTGHRQRLFPLEAIDESTARQVIADVQAFQRQALKEKGTRFVFASDEMYLRAGLALPSYDAYEDFSQIENGVGLIRKLEDEVHQALLDWEAARPRFKKVSVATGVDSYPFVREIFMKIAQTLGMDITVYPVENSFFGNSITVSGLLTGQDICECLKDKELGEALLIPDCMLKENETLFLDGMDLEQMKRKLGVEVLNIPVDGYDVVDALSENNEHYKG